MKKVFIFFVFVTMTGLVNTYSTAQVKKPAAKTATASGAKSALSAGDIEEGKNLIAKSDCMACHQIQAKVIGPAYQEVAAKYPATEANISKLADKIIKGGAGVWGQIPMSPHPSVPVADAKKMAAYILSLKAK